MERSHFPGYSRCVACQDLISDKHIRHHILNCRPRSLTDYKLCVLCNKQIPIKQHSQHVATCNQQEDTLPNKKNCPNCGNILDELNSHCQSCENNDNGYSTPRASTPTQTLTEASIGMISLKNEQKKHCVLCSKDIDQSDYENHISSCSIDGYSSNDQDVQQENISIEKTNNQRVVSNKKPTKYCILCSKDIDQSDYEDHVSYCSADENRPDNHNKKSNENIYSSQIDKNSVKELNTLKKKRTKRCVLCSKDIDQSDYEDHVASCSIDNTSSFMKPTKYSNEKPYSISFTSQNDQNQRINSNKNQTKQCVSCLQHIDQSDYKNHISSCSNNDNYSNNNKYNQKQNTSIQMERKIEKGTNSKMNRRKRCILCSKDIDQSEYEDHVASCSNDNNIDNSYDDLQYSRNDSIISSTYSNSKTEQKKKCILCSELINEQEYEEHISICSYEQPNTTMQNKKISTQTNNKKRCRICSNSIPEYEYVKHVASCSSSSSSSMKNLNENDHRTRLNSIEKHDKNSSNMNTKRKDCIICFKPIDLSEYESHVLACVAQTDNQLSTSSTRTNLKCLTCNRPINKQDGLYREINCHSHHNHCLVCLQRSMEEFARNGQAPVCHKSLCDYEFSRYDISLIPLERRISDRLLKLVKGQQRPHCSKCRFYIDLNQCEDFDEHVESCDDLIPCEYCQLPYPFKQLEIHASECQHDKTSYNEKLTNFILNKTKYPFTKNQIRHFIDQQSKNSHSDMDPWSIIDALAIFGSIFPYEMATRDCDVCMESCPYDDIYVFDCSDNHKLCYSCYYESCKTKMNNGEILTCALCTNPLREGELNQLRISNDELKKIRDYQIKKTFDAYSSRTRGIIKCPNQNCLWIAEAADPNERFRVTCPICNKEFCSLCNQQYHYRTTCQQLPQITQRWFFWCQTERGRYLTMRAQQDAAYATQLSDYNRQNNENENRNRDLRRRYDELMNDEKYKADNCRLCPQCKRVVQRLEGCDSMVCGQDAHGGNLQSGCGAKFNWAQAQQYNAAATPQPKQVILDLPKPENPVVHHNGVKCDHCQNDVVGIRFDCVHCPSLTYCEKCEQQATLDHSRENQFLQQQQHVFKLIMVPQEEANQL
ncbi:unnamed protein product [Rotaria sordida]|uniref:RING-type domain-containing protein n=1 Tax=Rotaria sordida TaxID=392033 RepID=A0A814C573_9BILA|nr:unnamed protein product [Rotaria sordida]